MKKSHASFLVKSLALTIILVTAACTNDDKETQKSSFTPPNIASNPINIDSNNQSTVVGTSLASSSGAASSGSDAQNNASGGNNSTAASTPIARAVRNAKLNALSSSSSLTTMETGSDTSPCNNSGGTVTYSYDTVMPLGPNFTFSAGDMFSVSYDNCQDTTTDINGNSITVITNGSVSITLNDASFTDMSAVFDGYTESYTDVNGNPVTTTVHGDVRIAEATTATSTIDSISGESLYLLSGEDNIRITNYTITDETTGTSLIENAEFGVDSDQLGGHIDVVFTNVTTNFTDMYPSSGQMVFTAENMILTVNILDNTQVSVEEDTNKDGVADTTTTVNWADLVIF